ncbi:tyrosine--tRNA ligase [candidate division WWE3 bacterium RIFCSPHIGHO2_01_FULL_42_13]|uniref:Tyrosine--tRNA ligase n=1 Tax=candidate division WWE3 bacterium RIFCSPHIGHO2_01_FULL_42_13 TaxID=1802617 RepID=A0A1F4UTW0_UNCKA|nr:MAG: tyrosine--tRNA ligase [candidate division WWE3 bacterium RIFCSPHIGHO2_01_FULL_42_13]
MPKATNTDSKKIDEILTRGVHEIFTKEELRKKLKSGRQLHLKLGTDVTGPNLHLGHTVVHRKLRDFQELGHKVTLIIGDFTTLVGDHSDKVDMREETSAAEIAQNEETYKEQFFKTVIEAQTEIRHNSEWLQKLNFNDVIGLAKQFTIAQMLERDTFMQRFKKKNPIGLDEFMYPLMQGYDSVALECDVEFGGTEQTFNLLAGRKIMPVFGLQPQSAVVMRLLTGNDGRPMGKSLKNFIPVNDTPNDMFGKIMSIVDDVIFEYFELVTRVPMEEIAEMKSEVKHGANPMEFKKRLAKEVVSFYHGENVAAETQARFERTVQMKELPDEMIVVDVQGNSTLFDTLKLALGESVSSSEIKRTIRQGGVEVNGIRITDPTEMIENKSGDVLKFGKRVFAKIK